MMKLLVVVAADVDTHGDAVRCTAGTGCHRNQLVVVVVAVAAVAVVVVVVVVVGL